jgi:GntR family transcriptional regulator
LSIAERPRGKTIRISGRSYELSGPLFVVERLRLADGIPMMEERRFIASALCPGLDQRDLEKSLYDIYASAYGLQLTSVHQTLSTVLIEQKGLLDLFQIDQPTPGFLVDGVTFCSRNVILEMEESLYRGDQYRFTVTATQ